MFAEATRLGPWRRAAPLAFWLPLPRPGNGHVCRENLVASIELFERGKEEIIKSRQSNERVPYNTNQDPDLLTAGRYLSIAYEEHGHRLADAAAQLGSRGETGKRNALT